LKPALLLIDLQEDFLAAEGLQPPREDLVEAAGRLLRGLRDLGVPVFHSWTTVREDSDRMPHWKRERKWACVEGTAGHATPNVLKSVDGERVFHKRFFDPFGAFGLEAALRAARADLLVVAGVYTHACVRAAALGGYERGMAVWVAEDAVGSDEPVHAAETRRWLDGRAARFLAVERILAEVKSRPPLDAAAI
jgi:alpha-ketoglutaric semialdehyde dehydrogenase